MSDHAYASDLETNHPKQQNPSAQNPSTSTTGTNAHPPKHNRLNLTINADATNYDNNNNDNNDNNINPHHTPPAISPSISSKIRRGKIKVSANDKRRNTAQKRVLREALHTPKSQLSDANMFTSSAQGSSRIKPFSQINVTKSKSSSNEPRRRSIMNQLNISNNNNNNNNNTLTNELGSSNQKTKTKNKNNGPPSSPNSVHPWRLPSSKFRAVWETINFFLYLINAFVIPTRIVFGIRDNYVEPIYITIPAIIIQSVFFIDLVLRGFLFAHEKQGIVVAAPTRIFSDYIRTWLLWDLVGFFPFYFVGQIFLPRQTASLLLSFQMLKLVRYFDYWKFIVVYFTRKQVEVNMTVIEIR